ncbi:MAG: protein kinase [Planctomycetes bacterium]|nr:protein kinase [Planctomycetota bacterium]
MTKEQLKIPKFESFEDFRRWWESDDITQFCRRHSDKLEQIREHPHVKPWIGQLKGFETAPVSGQPAGQVFGKYILEKKLGQGGMGVVYLAFDPVLNRKVAMKIMLLKGKTAEDRFMREARATAKLKHPNIINVYEVDMINKYHYFTMDYIEGITLEQLVKEKKIEMTLKDIVRIVRKIALALNYAHSEGVIHRDIKPANILVDSVTGEPYLTDFGLAKELESTEHSLTMSGTVVGTPDYMSPEQATGQKDKIDHLSDVFSLGAAFYSCLTGHLPFSGKELYQVMHNVVNKDPVLPSKYINPLDRDVETICMKCLEKERRKRYQSAMELAEDIKRYLEGETIMAKPAGFFTKTWRRAKQHKTVSAIAAGSMTVVVALIVSHIVSASGLADKINKYRQEAIQAYAEKRFDDALAKCNKILGIDPYNQDVKQLMLDCEGAKNEEAGRIARDKEAVRQEMENRRIADEKRARAKAVLDRITSVRTPFSIPERIRVAQEAIGIDPTYGEAYQIIGYAYKDANELQDAYEWFSKAIEATPTLTYSYFERARIIAKTTGNTEDVMRDLAKVIELDPNSSIAHYANGVTLTEQGKIDEAIQAYSKAISIYPDYEDALMRRADLYFRKINCELAITDYNKMLSLNPKNAMVHFNYARVLEFQGRENEALAAYTNAILYSIKFASAYHRRGLLYGKTGQYEKALNDLKTCLNIDPAYPFAKDITPLIEYYGKILNDKR